MSRYFYYLNVLSNMGLVKLRTKVSGTHGGVRIRNHWTEHDVGLH
jgi:hypothetical protein